MAIHADARNLHTAIAEDLFAHLRGSDHVFADWPRAHAVYDTTFYGCFRVEVIGGRACQVAIERMAGEAVFDWTMAEADRRRPVAGRRPPEHPTAPPSPDEAAYRAQTFTADGDKGQALLDALAGLDWGEPTPDGSAGRDGVILSGALTTDEGFRAWATWSPEPAVEPAKAAYFQQLRDFAVEQGSGDLVEQLARAIG